MPSYVKVVSDLEYNTLPSPRWGLRAATLSSSAVGDAPAAVDPGGTDHGVHRGGGVETAPLETTAAEMSPAVSGSAPKADNAVADAEGDGEAGSVIDATVVNNATTNPATSDAAAANELAAKSDSDDGSKTVSVAILVGDGSAPVASTEGWIKEGGDDQSHDNLAGKQASAAVAASTAEQAEPAAQDVTRDVEIIELDDESDKDEEGSPPSKAGVVRPPKTSSPHIAEDSKRRKRGEGDDEKADASDGIEKPAHTKPTHSAEGNGGKEGEGKARAALPKKYSSGEEASVKATKDEGGGMILPKAHTDALRVKLQELVVPRAAQRKGIGPTDVDGMDSTVIGAISNRVPTSIEELSEYGVGLDTLKNQGQQIISTILDFIHASKLEQYLVDKISTHGGGSCENNGQQHCSSMSGEKVPNGMTKEGLSMAESVEGGMVLPKIHTDALRAKLKEQVVSWAVKDQCISYQNILSERHISEISKKVPLMMEELTGMGLPNAFCEKYGSQLLSQVQAFVTARKLRHYVETRRALPIRPVANNAVNAPFVATMAATQPANPQPAKPAIINAPIIATMAADHHAQPLLASHTVSSVNGAGMSNHMNTGIGRSVNCQPAKQSHAILPTSSVVGNPPTPNRSTERWSEFRIDAASTVDELEMIHHRLMSLVNRVDVRLKERRLIDALALIDEASTDNLAELTTQDLMDTLSERVDMCMGCISGTDKITLSNGDISANGKRKANEVSDPPEMSSGDNNGRRLSMCPLCFQKIAAPSSCGTCEICGENGVCNQCYSLCTRCCRSACADCLVSCDGCSSRYDCLDCVIGGDGNDIVCPPKKAAGQLTPKSRVNHGLSNLSWANENVGYPNLYPPSNPPPLPSFAWTTSNQAKLTSQCFSYPLTNPSQHSLAQSNVNQASPADHTLWQQCSSSYHSPPPPRTSITRTVANECSHPPPNRLRSSVAQAVGNSENAVALSYPPVNSLPPSLNIQTIANPAKLMPKLFAVHRFIISEGGIIGLNITLQTKTQTCRVSNVHPNSVADHHGLKVNDEILLPRSNTTKGGPPNVYDLFLDAAKRKHRPLIFEVKRHFDVAAETQSMPIHSLQHSLHRFFITQQGPLGITVSLKNDNSSVYVKSVTPNSLAEIHGLRQNDVICKPFTNGHEKLNNVNWFSVQARSGVRPLVVEVWRALPYSMMEDSRVLWTGSDTNANPFMFSFPTTYSASQKDTIEEGASAEMTRTELGQKKNSDKVSGIENGEGSEPIILLDDDSDDAPNPGPSNCNYCEGELDNYGNAAK